MTSCLSRPPKGWSCRLCGTTKSRSILSSPRGSSWCWYVTRIQHDATRRFDYASGGEMSQQPICAEVTALSSKTHFFVSTSLRGCLRKRASNHLEPHREPYRILVAILPAYPTRPFPPIVAKYHQLLLGMYVCEKERSAVAHLPYGFAVFCCRVSRPTRPTYAPSRTTPTTSGSSSTWSSVSCRRLPLSQGWKLAIELLLL